MEQIPPPHQRPSCQRALPHLPQLRERHRDHLPPCQLEPQGVEVHCALHRALRGRTQAARSSYAGLRRLRAISMLLHFLIPPPHAPYPRVDSGLWVRA